ncbi:kinase-like domain-containing protein [Protomyces lactucae-debilis]|uniref:Phosphatidylinositol 3-kinase VPS34 n=1 Tax=Protomyces lactucae-debilis TaxID=2754530 RepID=A0A1Y2FD98_PROLT|nr:kinase-like domain-containing protein [Protomyces lactucae-debilis]ORY81577.1 kinase-like domain-containing protein [Protomyces lactucae-debilis]
MEQLTFSFLPSNRIDQPLQVRFNCLELAPSSPLFSSDIFTDPSLAFIGANTKAGFEFYITVTLWADNKEVFPSVQTRYRHNKTSKVTWNQVLDFPDIKCLSRSAQLAITVWDLKGPAEKYPFASTTVAIFDDDGVLKKGRQKLLLHKGVEADPYNDSTTPSKSGKTTELDRLEELVKSHEAGDIPRVDWLDNMTFRQLEKTASAAPPSEQDYLVVEFPRFDFPVLYTSGDYSYTLKEDKPLHHNSMVMVHDPDAYNVNPVETKHRKLVRSHRNGALDRDLKPSPRIRDHLFDILLNPTSSELSNEEKDLLWKFRYYLTRLPGALPKFLRSVVWADQVETVQAVALLSRWSTITVDSALEILGPAFTNAQVREFAVSRLEKAEDGEINLYLLQLVQALRYEPEASPLSAFLVRRGQNNSSLGAQLYWYLTVESSDAHASPVFGRTLEIFLSSMDKPQYDSLDAQKQWVQDLTTMAEQIKVSKENRLKRIEKLRSWANEHASLERSIPFPLDPHLNITGFIPEACNVFKSSMFPLKLSLKTEPARDANHISVDGTCQETFDIIFKSGDDLRQDQLVIQIITLFNDLLLRENLDLKLTPYRILATSTTSGFVEFVHSASLGAILSEQGSLGAYLGGTSTRKVDEVIMDTYTRSCAGYCVITYLLGVGDRHLDNLLLTKTGHFFHADFGFILGRDPKPFAPALKLAKEMVEVMNANSPSHEPTFWYSRFKSYCFTAFSALRKNSGLILNLFALMVDANIPDIKIEPQRAVGKIMERFCLEMDEEQSLRFFEDLLIESVSALFPVFIDRVHTITQYWRS